MISGSRGAEGALSAPENQPLSRRTSAVRDGVAMLTWAQDGFAFADSYDEGASRYRGLRAGEILSLVDADAPGIVVKPDVARRQLDAETATATGGAGGAGAAGQGAGSGQQGVLTPPPAVEM